MRVTGPRVSTKAQAFVKIVRIGMQITMAGETGGLAHRVAAFREREGRGAQLSPGPGMTELTLTGTDFDQNRF